MSKMSQLHAELSEQASELGFSSIEEAEANGYGIDYEKGKLVDGRELAHDNWSKEKEEILDSLEQLQAYLGNKVEHGNFNGIDDWEVVSNTINFIKKGDT